jgi:hypothetical protein
MIEGLRKIEMACPYCRHVSRVRLHQINKIVACQMCSGIFTVSPDVDKLDIIRVSGGCSRTTLGGFAVAMVRKADGRYHFGAAWHDSVLSRKMPITNIPIDQFDFNEVRCPYCSDSTGVDICRKHKLIMCRGGAKVNSSGRWNVCFMCGPVLLTDDATEVPIFNDDCGVKITGSTEIQVGGW